MGEAHEFEKEKLIVGVIYHDPEYLRLALEALVAEFGEVEDISPEYSFSKGYSEYYDPELGGEGLRRIYSFRETVDPERQAEIKGITNLIERRLSVGGMRKINLDPGFINRGRLLLATTKEASFRIPLSDGIYTEITLFYARGRWNKLPWTYMDYQSEVVQDFLKIVRNKYLRDRQGGKPKRTRKRRKVIRNRYSK